MVHSRVSFSVVCQSPEETDSDHRTMPMSGCGHDPSRPRPKYPRSESQNAIWNRIANKLPCRASLSIDFPRGVATNLVRCVQTSVQSWRYPQPEGGEVEVDYPMRFGSSR